MDVLKRAQEIFGNDHYATDACGIVIEEASDGHAVVSIELEGKHKNAVGQVMGAVYFTLADFAFAVASNYDRPMTVTLQSSMTFMNACRGSRVSAVAERISEGGSTCFFEVSVRDELGTPLAGAQVTGHKISPWGRRGGSVCGAGLSHEPGNAHLIIPRDGPRRDRVSLCAYLTPEVASIV